MRASGNLLPEPVLAQWKPMCVRACLCAHMCVLVCALNAGFGMPLIASFWNGIRGQMEVPALLTYVWRKGAFTSAQASLRTIARGHS